MRFGVGDRVIVTGDKASSPNLDMNGYYGHVVELHPISRWVDVSLMGRVGNEARSHDLDPDGDDPWPFRESELDHTD